MPAKKWFERVVGENSECYLVTTTNFEEHKERAPKWLPKGSISAELVSNWQALRSAVQAGLDAVQHEVYSPYMEGNQVAVYTDGDLFAYIDMLPLGIAMRNALGGKYSKIPGYYYDHARFFSNGQSAAAPSTAPPGLPSALECRDPANLNVEHQELFHCSSEHHAHNLRSCKACSGYAMAEAIEAGKGDLVEHGAALPLCVNCVSNHIENNSKLCACFQFKCVQCVRDTIANMEARKFELDHTTNFGEWCLECLADVDGYLGANKCVNCDGIVVLPTLCS